MLTVFVELVVFTLPGVNVNPVSVGSVVSSFDLFFYSPGLA